MGFKFDGIYSCYHHPEEGCNCREPYIGNFIKAANDLDIDISQSYMVGDKLKDVMAGQRAGCKKFLDF